MKNFSSHSFTFKYLRTILCVVTAIGGAELAFCYKPAQAAISGFFMREIQYLHFMPGLDEASARMAGRFTGTPTSFSPGTTIGVVLPGLIKLNRVKYYG